MTCEVVRTYLSAFMDEALPAGIMADIREHFAGCESCDELYLTMRSADRFYGAAPGREVPHSYRDSLRERMTELVSDDRGS